MLLLSSGKTDPVPLPGPRSPAHPLHCVRSVQGACVRLFLRASVGATRASTRATRVIAGEDDARAVAIEAVERGVMRARGGTREGSTRTTRRENDVGFRSRCFRASMASRGRGVDGERDEIAWRMASPKRSGGGACARRRDEEGLTETFSPPQPSNKTFKVNKILGKKAKQNRPLPQWIRMRTDNKIRYVSFQGF